MKKVLLIWLMIGLIGSLKAQNVVYVSLQPTDLGIGLRYDRQINEFGVYVSFSKGEYKLYNEGYIKDHIKASIGAMVYSTQHSSFITMGINYHHYGKHYLPSLYGINTLSPVSIELGVGTFLNRFTVALRMDIIKWESSLDFGFKF